MFYLSDYKNIDANNEIDGERSKSEYSRSNMLKQKSTSKSRLKLCGLFRCVCELLDEYCKFSSLHGLRYIRDSTLPRIERLFWLGIFLTCLYISGIVVKRTYLAGMTHEYQLVYNPKSTPIREIPFPAVIVCSSTPIRKSFFDLSKHKNHSKLRHFSKLVCKNRMSFDSEFYNDTIEEEFFEFLNNAAIKCEDLIINCYWGMKKRNCCSLFLPIITQHGMCYAFNNLPGEVLYKYYRHPPGRHEIFDDELLFWDIDFGYPSRHGSATRRVFPRWADIAGALSGLTLDLIDIKEERQIECSGSQTGYKILIYSPDKSYETETFISIPDNVHSFIKLDPTVIRAEESLRQEKVDHRECSFADEVQLEYFNYYTPSSCLVECFTRNSLRLCGCVPFTSRRLLGNFGYPYCNAASVHCLLKLLADQTRILTETTNVSTDALLGCKCIASCSWMVYNMQTSFQKRFTENYFGLWNEANVSSKNNIARLTIYFEKNQFNSIKRKRALSDWAVLGNCGGLLGLLLGFSFMSLLEIVYFTIIRPVRKMLTLVICMYKNRFTHFNK